MSGNFYSYHRFPNGVVFTLPEPVFTELLDTGAGDEIDYGEMFPQADLPEVIAYDVYMRFPSMIDAVYLDGNTFTLVLQSGDVLRYLTNGIFLTVNQ